jgi:hypothetical protein
MHFAPATFFVLFADACKRNLCTAPFPLVLRLALQVEKHRHVATHRTACSRRDSEGRWLEAEDRRRNDF